MQLSRRLLLAATAIVLLSPAARAAEVVNIYNSRHYGTDQALWDGFTKETGIQVNVVDGTHEQLIQRMQSEGANSPADVFITVDAGRLAQASGLGLLQPIESEVLDARIPAILRDPDGLWYGLAMRARVLVYAKDRIQPDAAQHLRGVGRARVQGQDRRAQQHQRLQSEPRRLDPRRRRAGSDRDVVRGAGRQHGAPAGGRRHRPDQGGRRRRRRRRHLQHLLPRPPQGVGQARGPGDRREAGRVLPQPGRPRHPRQRLGRRRAQDRTQPRQCREADRVPDLARGAALLRRRQHGVSRPIRRCSRIRCWPSSASSSRTR